MVVNLGIFLQMSYALSVNLIWKCYNKASYDLPLKFLSFIIFFFWWRWEVVLAFMGPWNVTYQTVSGSPTRCKTLGSAPHCLRADQYFAAIIARSKIAEKGIGWNCSSGIRMMVTGLEHFARVMSTILGIAGLSQEELLQRKFSPMEAIVNPQIIASSPKETSGSSRTSNMGIIMVWTGLCYN